MVEMGFCSALAFGGWEMSACAFSLLFLPWFSCGLVLPARPLARCGALPPPMCYCRCQGSVQRTTIAALQRGWSSIVPSRRLSGCSSPSFAAGSPARPRCGRLRLRIGQEKFPGRVVISLFCRVFSVKVDSCPSSGCIQCLSNIGNMSVRCNGC
jgi:hypothetical protein